VTESPPLPCALLLCQSRRAELAATTEQERVDQEPAGERIILLLIGVCFSPWPFALLSSLLSPALLLCQSRFAGLAADDRITSRCPNQPPAIPSTGLRLCPHICRPLLLRPPALRDGAVICRPRWGACGNAAPATPTLARRRLSGRVL